MAQSDLLWQKLGEHELLDRAAGTLLGKIGGRIFCRIFAFIPIYRQCVRITIPVLGQILTLVAFVSRLLLDLCQPFLKRESRLLH